MILGGFLPLFIVLTMVLWTWMMIDCATRESDQGNTKLVRVIIFVFGNFLGALIYLFVRRPQRWAELGR